MSFILLMFIVYLCTLCSLSETNGITHSLNGADWFISDGDQYKNVAATIPNDIYNVLFESKDIADPYFKDNDVHLRHIGEKNFNFSIKFQLSSALEYSKSIWLVSRGIDTVSNVHLNDHFVGGTENMFRSYVWDVSRYIRRDNAHNTLVISFESPVSYSDARYKNASGNIQYTLCQPSVVNAICQINYIRKMQASFGWDWGPAFPTQGIWRPIWLQATDSCFIDTISAVPVLNGTDWIVNVHLKLFCSKQTQATITVSIPQININDKWTIGSTEMGLNHIMRQVNIPSDTKVRLWWPLGYGHQVLYKVIARFVAKSQFAVSELSREISIGFRSVQLVEEPIGSRAGLTFYIVVNGVPVFLKGTNWIPNDSFLSRVSRDRLEYMFVSMVQANINSMRVWGGGVYESDYFYELADQHGIMIWHDMMFACALYPADTDFLDNVKKETEDQVRRLQHHPSIILWAGNNENELGLVGGWFRLAGAKGNMHTAREDYKELYNSTIWGVINRTDYGSRPYVMSSPSNGLKSIEEGGISTNPGNARWGDMHVYKYASDAWLSPTYPKARCVTEYGFQSFPSMATLKMGIPDKKDLGYFTPQVMHRQHHTGGQVEMLAEVLKHFWLPNCKTNNNTAYNAESFKDICSEPVNSMKTEEESEYEFLESMIYLSQIHQAIAYQTETEHYRRWRNRTEDGEGQCMCSLYWQLNDIWQAPTWATIDYGGKWKAAHYLAKRFFSPTIVSPFWHEKGFKVAVVSDNLKPLENAIVIVDVLRWGNTTLVTSNEVKLDPLTPLTAHIVYNGSVSSEESDYLVRTRLVNERSRKAIAPDNVLHPIHLFAVDSSLWGTVAIGQVYLESPSNFAINVTCSSICPFVWLDQGDNVMGYFSDNAFTMTTPFNVIIFTSWDKQMTLNNFKKNLSVMTLGDLYK